MKTFCRGMEKKDERTLFVEMRDKAQMMWNGERLVRRNVKDRAIFFVVQGQFTGLDDCFPVNKQVYKPGSILGCEQFLKDDPWDVDIICEENQSLVVKFDYDQFSNLCDSNA